jgi:hypothetical protein
MSAKSVNGSEGKKPASAATNLIGMSQARAEVLRNLALEHVLTEIQLEV